ncbi:MAG: polyprenyl synthetase family protein [Nitrospinae bacterium]|nr:polyprenyl synthetase family protein [Nitrospinota bacterium]
MNIKNYLSVNIERVNSVLDELLVEENHYPENISNAVRYSVFAGGKRIRPLLSIAASECLGINPERFIRFGAAIELIHTYTLIHDDLPCIDNDDYRRGKKTCHKVFGEALAVLAGDALQTCAFEVFSQSIEAENINPKNQLNALWEFTRAIGIDGTIGGQVVDIESEGKEMTASTLEYIHDKKTGALILFSVKLPALLEGSNEKSLKALSLFGEKIGLAFQVVDDILDITGNEKTLGKTPGKDEKSKKLTYPSLYGIEKSREIADTLYGEAVNALDMFGNNANNLKSIAELIVKRNS